MVISCKTFLVLCLELQAAFEIHTLSLNLVAIEYVISVNVDIEEAGLTALTSRAQS